MERGGNNIIDLAFERRKRGPRFDGGLMDILEVSRDLVCLCRNGAITAINGAGARLLGAQTTEEVIGHRLAEFLIPEYGQVLELFMAGKASEDKAIPTRIVALDHSVKDVELQVFRAREIAGDATVVMCRDISHEGKLAGAARATDIRFHLLVDNAMNLVCQVADGTIRYVNAAGLAMLGAAGAEAVVGLELGRLFHGEYARVAEPDLLASVIAEDAPVPMKLARLDGTALDAVVRISRLPSARGMELMVEARDIGPQIRAVAALRRSAETLEMRVAERTRELTEARAQADELRLCAESARRFTESLLDAIPSPVWMKDARGHIETCNRAFRDLFRGDGAFADAMGSQDQESDAEIMRGEAERAGFEVSVEGVDGQVFGLALKTAFRDGEGRTVGIIGVLTDITERKAMEGELRRLATTDPLTGAANRRCFLAHASAELDRTERYRHPLSVLMLDIDHFKAINDRFGHPAGDEALRRLVATCREALRDVDLVGRLGGEEFAILLPETSLNGALDVAERLRARIEAMQVARGDGGQFSLTASVGVAALEGGDTIQGLLARADQALYRAKHGGRNRVEAAT